MFFLSLQGVAVVVAVVVFEIVDRPRTCTIPDSGVATTTSMFVFALMKIEVCHDENGDGDIADNHDDDDDDDDDSDDDDENHNG